MKIGAKLIKYRTKIRMSQQELSNKTGIPQTTLSSYESDKSSPNIEKLSKIAAALGKNIKKFLPKKAVKIILKDNEIAIGQNFAEIKASKNLIKRYKDKIKYLEAELDKLKI